MPIKASGERSIHRLRWIVEARTGARRRRRLERFRLGFGRDDG
jgi:hypothetical protein